MRYCIVYLDRKIYPYDCCTCYDGGGIDITYCNLYLDRKI